MTQVRVGVTLPQFTADGDAFAGAALSAEKLGLDSVWVFDHLWPLSGGRERPILESWTALSYLAAATDRIGLGTLVTRSTLRHPAVLGKMAATVAIIAPGRLTVALGSGDEASKDENDAFGIPYFAESDRLDQFESTVASLRAYLSGGPVSRNDRFVSLSELPPSPIPEDRPTIWVAGRSDDALEIAGTHADGWNGWGGTPERFAQDAAGVTDYARASGDRAVELTWGGLVVLADDDDAARAKLGKRRPSDYVVGGPESVARHLASLVDAGARHLICTFSDAGDPAVYELLATSVREELEKLI
ncbi:MAG: LLM class flavin-dependent oxidoreductase [Actinomycetota bacterium]|nr:LLM class flavin-dependent oxidoreductase [Actinomycetota bacterium]